ncbi:MAG: NAD(P)-dependent oxidoreductase [Planctomycetota bacterium]
MRIRNVLVTGAGGKIGRNLVPALLARGYDVTAVRFRSPLPFKGATVLKGSVSDRAFVRRALRGIDAVCHLATSKEDEQGFIDVSVRGTFNLLEECRRSSRVKQFLLAGGDAALGIFFYPHPVPLNETAPLAAYPGVYALSKVLEETLCNQYVIQHSLPVTILRFSWIQDEDDILAYMTLAEPNFGGPPWKDLARTAKQKSFFRKKRDAVGCLRHPGGAPYKRHVVGARDVVQSFLLALGNPRARGETFNIAAPAPASYDVLSAYIAQRLKLPVVDFTLDGFHDFSIDISKARSVLGYRPEYDVFRIVDEAVDFRRLGRTRTPVRYFG